MEANHCLKSFAKTPRGIQVGLCRRTSRAQCLPCPTTVPCPHSVQGWIHKRLQLTELKKKRRSNSWCEEAETQELLLGPLLQLRACPHQGRNLPAAVWVPQKSSFDSTHNLKSNISSPNIHPSLLGNGLGSFCPPPPPLPGLLSSCFRDAQAAPWGRILRTPTPRP